MIKRETSKHFVHLILLFRHLILTCRCGAFANDPHSTASDFRQALENDFAGAFSDIVFAITDWSLERKILGPFRDVFTPNDK